METLLKTESLTKDFGNQKGAFDINIEVTPGEVVGFIGPNGAGKTTTMSMMVGFTKPVKGDLEIFEKKANYRNIHSLMPEIGVLISEASFEPNFTAEQIFRKNEKLLEKDLSETWKKMAKYLDLDLRKKFKKLSLGNRKKVGIINSLMHDPKLVILDEPTSGLDPLIQQKFLEIINSVRERGGGVFLSSHVLSEVQHACDRIVMIKDGNVILKDETKNILNNALKVFRVGGMSTDAIDELEKKELIEKWEDRGGETLLFARSRKPILDFLIKNKIYDFYLEKPNLEDMFLEQY